MRVSNSWIIICFLLLTIACVEKKTNQTVSAVAEPVAEPATTAAEAAVPAEPEEMTETVESEPEPEPPAPEPEPSAPEPKPDQVVTNTKLDLRPDPEHLLET
ncbi:MAG: hypothetical protein MI867_02260, partial [Pseudomonadales bacterium]|nr:hypothetical protein [Pseudomonadales bacterium]